jgi:hypothetical protein
MLFRLSDANIAAESDNLTCHFMFKVFICSNLVSGIAAYLFACSLLINGTHQLLVYDDYVNLLGDNRDIIKKSARTLIDATKEVGPEVNKDTFFSISCLGRFVRQFTEKGSDIPAPPSRQSMEPNGLWFEWR